MLMSPDLRSDTELVIAYRAGDEAVFAFLVERHLTNLYRFLVRMTQDRHSAEDLVQETFLKAWKNLPRFDAHKSFKTWLFSIAHHAAIDHLRKQRAVPFARLENEDEPDFSATIPDTKELPDAVLSRRDLADLLEESLQTLPSETRSTILLHEHEGLTFQEIADATQTPMNTVKSRYRRALSVLRRHLLGKV